MLKPIPPDNQQPPDKASVQLATANQEPIIGGRTIIPMLFQSSDYGIAPGWNAADMDSWLRAFWPKFGNDVLQSVLAAAIAKVQTQNWVISGPEKLATLYRGILRDDADFRRGWSTYIARGVNDYYTQNKGWFTEIQRASFDEHEGPALGIAHIDAARMYQSGNAEYPWAYLDTAGDYHLMHVSQVQRIVDMPTPITTQYGLDRGFCALARAISTAMIVSLLVSMKREKLSDLPPSAIAVLNNINKKQFDEAITLHALKDDEKGNTVWRELMPLFGIDPAHPAAIQFISMREVWEGYTDMEAMNVAVYSFAAAFRMDPREFWPVSAGPLGTGKEAEIQHEKAKAKSFGLLMTEIERSLNSDRVLPHGLSFKFELQDADEEEQRAGIHQTQIQNIKSMQDAGAQLSPEEVRYLLANEYRVIPQFMAQATDPSTMEGNTETYMDDVERDSKEWYGMDMGPAVRLHSDGRKEYLSMRRGPGLWAGFSSDIKQLLEPSTLLDKIGKLPVDERRKLLRNAAQVRAKIGSNIQPDAISEAEFQAAQVVAAASNGSKPGEQK